MTTSSVQESYSTISFDDIQLDQISGLTTSQLNALTATDTITLTSGASGASGSSYYYTTGSSNAGIGTISVCGGSSYTTTTNYCIPSSISISGIDSIWGGAEWVNSFPDWDRIQKMCKEYPGLKIAFEKFKTTYHLVKDDYDSPKDKK